MRALRFLPWVLITGGVLLAGESQRPFGKATHRIDTQSLTLDEAVQLALRQNPQVLTAEQEIERTRGQVIEVRSQALPLVSINASYQQEAQALAQGGGLGGGFGSPMPTPSGIPESTGGVTPTPAPTPTPTPTATPTASPTPTPSPSPGASPSPKPGPGPNTPGANFIQNKTWQVTIQATQVLYSGGRIAASIRMAKLTEDQIIFKLRDTIDQVIATVRQQFFQVVVNKALITVQEESVRLLRSQLADQKNRYEAGTVPRFNVLQAQVALANALPALIQARNNYHLSQLQLAKTLGYETRSLVGVHQEPFNVIGELSIQPIGTDLESALIHARERRPFLKAQRQNILIEVQDLIVQKSGYKPTLQANAGYTLENQRFSKSLGDVVHGWFFGIQGNWNIFDGFQTHGRVKQARARLEEAHINYDDSVQQVELEVQQAWANLQQAKETIQSQLESVVQAEEAVRLSRERLGAGAGTQLDVLNATVALTQAHTTVLQARYSYISALAEFDRVTGAATRYTETFKDPLLDPPHRAVWKETSKAAPPCLK